MQYANQRIGRILITISIAFTAIVSTVVDLLPGEAGHVFDPSWPGHAIFHDVVMFLFLDFMAVVCLWLLWRKSLEPKLAVKVATLLVIGFWTPFYYITFLFSEASLSASDEGVSESEAGHQAGVLGEIFGLDIYINVLIGTAMIILALAGYFIFIRGAWAEKTDGQ